MKIKNIFKNMEEGKKKKINKWLDISLYIVLGLIIATIIIGGIIVKIGKKEERANASYINNTAFIQTLYSSYGDNSQGTKQFTYRVVNDGINSATQYEVNTPNMWLMRPTNSLGEYERYKKVSSIKTVGLDLNRNVIMTVTDYIGQPTATEMQIGTVYPMYYQPVLSSEKSLTKWEFTISSTYWFEWDGIITGESTKNTNNPLAILLWLYMNYNPLSPEDTSSIPNGAYNYGYGIGQQAGREQGYQEGFDGGYTQGFNEGYTEGINDAQNNSFNPIGMIMEPVATLLGTKLFGNFSIGSFFTVALFVAIALIFIKMFAGG